MKDEPYLSELQQSGKLIGEKGPHYSFKTPSVQVFNDNFKELERKLDPDQRIGYTTEERSDVASLLLNWGFLLLIFWAFWLFMRRMAGPGGGAGQIFNIGKSKAALFDAESQSKNYF